MNCSSVVWWKRLFDSLFWCKSLFLCSHRRLFYSCLFQTRWPEKSVHISSYSVWDCGNVSVDTFLDETTVRICQKWGIWPSDRDRCWCLAESLRRQISNCGPVFSINCQPVSTQVGQNVLTVPNMLITSLRHLIKYMLSLSKLKKCGERV